jgi:type I restriction enzyme, R subunit
MSSNFQFLKNIDTDFAKFFDLAIEAEQNVYKAPRLSALMCRIALEDAIRWMYDHDEELSMPYQNSLSALMSEPSFKDNLAPSLNEKIQLIRKLGNQAAHTKAKPDPLAVLASIRNLYFFFKWMVLLYSEERPEITVFDESLIPVASGEKEPLIKLQSIESNYLNNLKELKRKDQKLRESEEENKRLKEELQQINKVKQRQRTQANAANYHEGGYSESLTRSLFIDILLREAGWDPKGVNVEEYEVKGMPETTNPTGIGYIDYVLWGDNGLPLAIIEAKKTKVDAHKGQHQAELYANCLEQMTGQRPIIFYSNGFEHWIWDDHFYPSRPIQGFYTKDELNLLIQRRTSQKDLRSHSINKDIAGRYYQEEAIRRLSEDFGNKKRGALLVMATGSGKTRTAAAIVDLLTKANWIKNVLFLADRNALVTQAKNAFKEHVPSLNGINLTKEKEDHLTRLVFSTYPSLMNKIDSVKTGSNRFYGPGHFDLIIIDEAHRSVYQKYKAIFDYFDSLLLGLTATPKSEVDKNTYELFDLATHEPTYAYELDKAVNDKYLTPPKAMSYDLKFPNIGIKYKDLSEEEKAEYELTFRDEETGNMPEEIESTAINKWLFNKNTVDKVLHELMKDGQKIEGGNKLGKTIIFAASHKHAIFIEKRFNLNYPESAGKFLRVIDNYEEKAESLLEDFSTPNKFPNIAVSVDMLDTGIDIHEIVNLVFFKRVRSSSKFWQMIGRGTRLCENLFGPNDDKKFFLIFDFCKNFEFFDQFPDGFIPGIQISLNQKLFNARLQLAEILREEMFHDDDHQTYRTNLLDTLHSQIAALNEENFIVRMKLRYVTEYKHRRDWDDLSQNDLADIKIHLAPLTITAQTDELAIRFDLLMLNLEIAFLNNDRSQANYINQLKSISRSLLRKTSIPMVNAKVETIRMLISDEFWSNVNVMALERAREELRDLIKFLDKAQQPIVYTNFEDEFVSAVRERDVITLSKDLEGYRMRVEKFINENQQHITIHKLKNNIPISQFDLEVLGQILFDGDKRGTKADFEKEFGKQSLGTFIRNIVGLDVNAAKEAFADFLTGSNLNADQIKFIDSIIDHLSHNGIVDKKALFEPPFTDINDQGILGVFNSGQVKELFGIVEWVNGNAEVA